MDFNETYDMKDECVLENLSYHVDDVARLEFQPCLQPEIMSRDVYFGTKRSNGDTEESNKKKGGVLNSFLTYYILDK
jgi:hypothetical protein